MNSPNPTPPPGESEVQRAKRRLFARIVACAHLLDKPFTDEPTLSRWELIKRDMNALDHALKSAGKGFRSEAPALDRVWWVHRCVPGNPALTWFSDPVAADAPRPERCGGCGEAANWLQLAPVEPATLIEAEEEP